MYGHTNHTSVYPCSSGFLQHHHSVFSKMASPDLTGELDTAARQTFKTGNESGKANGIDCVHSIVTSYINSPTSPISHPTVNDSASLMQRSLSSQSLLFHNNGFYPPIASLPLSNVDVGHLRRVFSTGDLAKVVNLPHINQEQEGSPLEIGSPNSILGGMNKAVRYNPEEKRERIERYRSKRNRRNFNKKIQYACRKTLADTRPRIRGRFVRNEEIETVDYATSVQWNQIEGEEEYDNWIHLLDSISSNLVP